MQPIIILSDTENEASLVSLVFQKAQRSFVSIALNEKDSKTDFPKLLDILLSNDYHTPKNSIKPLRGLLGGWTWWRSWAQRSDTNTSSSDYYKSASAEEEKVVLIAPTKKEDASFIEDSHSKKYFEAIHNCLDGMMAEIDRSSIGTQIAAQLVTIVNSLLYTHLVKVLPEEVIGKDFAEIEALHLAAKTEESLGRSDALEGTFLMILTRKNMLLVTAAMADLGIEEKSNEVDDMIEENENEKEKKEENEESAEIDIEKEMEKEDEKVNEKEEVKEEEKVNEKEDERVNEKEEEKEDEKVNENIIVNENLNLYLNEHEHEHENDSTENESIQEGDIENHSTEDTAIENEGIENESIESTKINETNDLSQIKTETASENDQPESADSSKINETTQFMESTDIIPTTQAISLEDEVDAEEDSLDVDEQRDMEIISRIVESLERFGSCSVDEAKEIDWNHCDSYLVKGVIPLQEIQNVNILVSEENAETTTASPQIIHIRYGCKGEIYLQVDYAIFVVNEIMNRIGTFLLYVCFICSVVCVC